MIFHEEVSKKLADRGIINSWNNAMKYRSCRKHLFYQVLLFN